MNTGRMYQLEELICDASPKTADVARQADQLLLQ